MSSSFRSHGDEVLCGKIAAGAFVALMSISGFADTWYLKASITGNADPGLKQINWVDANGVVKEGCTDADSLSSEDDYVVDGNLTLATGGSFTGKSLTIGGRDGTHGAIIMRGNTQFPNENTVLRLVNGYIYKKDSSSRFTLSGAIEVHSPISKPVGVRNRNAGATLVIAGHPISAASDAALMIGHSIVDNGYTAKGTYFVLSEDYSAYNGTVIVTSKYDNVTSPQFYGVGFALGGTITDTFPGTIKVCGGGGLVLARNKNVGTLIFDEGSTIRANVDFANKTCGAVTVTDSLAVNGKVSVTADFEMKGTTGFEMPLITGPKGCRIDLSKFEFIPKIDNLSNNVFPQFAHLTVKTTDDIDTLYLVVEPLVSLKRAGSDPPVLNEACDDGAYWSDGLPVHSDANYDFHIKSYLTESWDCGGAQSVLFRGGGSIQLDKFNVSLTAPCIYWTGPFSLYSGKANVSVSGGKIFMNDEYSAVILWNGRVGSSFTIGSELVGTGTLRVTSWDERSDRSGRVVLGSKNKDYSGGFLVAGVGSNLTPSNHVVNLCISDPDNLGGTLDSLNFRAVELRNYGRLYSEADVVLDSERNRGVFVNTNGCIAAAEGKTLDIEWPVTMVGSLWLTGSGVVKLSSPMRFYDADTDSSVDNPGAEAAFVEVHGASLKVGAAACCDGATVSVWPDGEIVLPIDPEDADVRKWGLRNVKTDVPFALAGGAESIKVRFEGDAVMPYGEVRTNAVCTVKESAAEDVMAMLPKLNPYGTPAKCVSVADGKGEATIYSVSIRKALTISIR